MFCPASEDYLPTELLLIIFDYLDYDDLCRLTNVSPRFSNLSLIVYFAKRKVAVSSDGQIDLPNHIKAKEMLPLIPKARFVTSIDRLSCGFAHPHQSFLESISSLTAVLRSVESVEELTVDFFTSGETWTPALIKQANTGNALVTTLNELFTVAARVSHSIVVRNGASLKSVLQKVEKAGGLCRRLSWPFGPISRFFPSSEKQRKRLSAHCHTATTNDAPCVSTPFVVSTRGSLQILEINSILLLSPPFLDWSIQALNSNDITDLTFGTIEFREVDWSSLLSQIHIPALASLTFRAFTPFSDLVTFMGRHQSITSLAVNNLNFEGWNPSPASSSDKLTGAFINIKRLACCPQGLVVLLSGVLHPSNPDINIFPNLRVISVLWNLGVGDILAPIVDKLKAFEKAVFVLTYRTEAGSSWRTCPPSISVERPRSLLRRSVLLSNPASVAITHEASFTNSPVVATVGAPSPSGGSLFAAFSGIRLEVTPRADRDGIPALVKALAETFTNIRHFKVDTRARAGRPPQENKLMKLYLCHHILKHFKHLKAVYIDGIRSKVVERDG